MTITELNNELNELNYAVKNIIGRSSYNQYDDLSGLETNDNLTADERMMIDELREILEHLDQVSRTLDYLSKPVKGEHTLYRNPETGRFECKVKEFTCGSSIEFYYKEEHKWVISSVEYNSDYYIVGYPEVELERLRIRIRV